MAGALNVSDRPLLEGLCHSFGIQLARAVWEDRDHPRILLTLGLMFYIMVTGFGMRIGLWVKVTVLFPSRLAFNWSIRYSPKTLAHYNTRVVGYAKYGQF